MAITDYEPSPISSVVDRLGEAKYDPTLLIAAELETIELLTNGEVVLADPTHPAVMLLEMSAVNSANNLQETISLLRKQYPSLAYTESDLYRHMSDIDYINCFATPSKTRLTFAILMNDLNTRLIRDNSERCWKGVIPRNSKFTVDNTVFVLDYPIVIRRYDTGAIQIAYDTSIASPIQNVNEVVITPTVRTSATGENWLFFEVEVIQLSYNTSYFTLDKIYNFKKDIDFIDQYYYTRVYYRNNKTNNAWVEIKTTHSDQVFDSNVPTALLTVLSNQLSVKIPVIYFTSDQLSGELRVDVYTTKGELVMNLANYTPEQFSAVLMPIDEEKDYSDYVDTFSNISYYVYSPYLTSGGKSKISFEQLRDRVIYNSTGPQVLPITTVNLDAAGENNGFDIVKTVDVLTKRIMLASRKLPKPSSPRLITPANLGMVTYVGVMNDLLRSSSAIQNQDRFTIKANSIYKRTNGKLQILNSAELNYLQTLGQTSFIREINENDYLYSPFYYVLDESTDEFDVRVYSLNLPIARNLSFVRQNQTLQLFVNTKAYTLIKTPSGYRLTIETNSGTYFKTEPDSSVGVQLAFLPYGENTLAYINGTLIGKTENNERIYQFDIETNHDIDSDNLICITNAEVQGISDYQAWISLNTDFNIIYHTTSTTTNYVADKTDLILGKFLLPVGSVGNAHETIQLELGKTLKQLWRRAHSYQLDTVYQTYDHDIPLLYEQDTYEQDPVTGATFSIVNGEVVYNTLHLAGEAVLDTEGNPVYKHRKGDVILDANQEPLTISSITTGREFDMLVIDASYYFANDTASVSYRQEIETVLCSWITEDVISLQDSLLEKTYMYFYPKNTLGQVEVYVENNEQLYVDAEQEFTVILYVSQGIYDDVEIRTKIENSTTALLDQYVSKSVINMTEIRNALRTMYGDTVKGFKLDGLGGDRNFEIVQMVDGRQNLSLKKKLVIQADRKLFVTDAVNFDFRVMK